MNKKLLYLGIGAAALFFFAGIPLLFFLFSNGEAPDEPDQPPQRTAGPAPTAQPPAIDTLLQPENGETPRIDTGSVAAERSRQEIDKLRTALPYSRDFVSAAGIPTSIVIPAGALQEKHPWKLTVQVYGIDYAYIEDPAEYERMRRSFLEAAAEVFRWMRAHGADPNRVFITWGDQAYVQERATSWLSSSQPIAQ